jgi:hypothetical protein
MHRDSEHDPALKALEASLANLAPAQAALDRDRILFQAGKASMRRGRLMPAFVLLSTLAWIAIGVNWYFTATPNIGRIVYVPVVGPAPTLFYKPESDPAADALSWLSLTENWGKPQTLRQPQALEPVEFDSTTSPTTAGLSSTLHVDPARRPWSLPWSFQP